jgi:hypothetical protein
MAREGNYEHECIDVLSVQDKYRNLKLAVTTMGRGLEEMNQMVL